MSKKRVLILGGGLAGLSAASLLTDRGYAVTVVERAPKAGGCTSSWIDHRDPERGVIRKGQMQMNFNFYRNLNWFAWRELDAPDLLAPGVDPASRNWWDVGSSAYSDKLAGFNFYDQHGRHTSLSAAPRSFMGRLFKKLPAPLSAMQIMWDFDGLPRLRDKLSAVKFHLLAILFGQKAVPPINDDWNFYGLMAHLGMTHEAIEAYRRITYSITNLADADQVGPKFLHLFYLAYLRDKDSIGCRMMNDDCNEALIDRAVASLQRRGVEFRFDCGVRDFMIENGRCYGVVVDEAGGLPKAVCPNCGQLQPVGFMRTMCTACGSHHRVPAAYPAPTLSRLEADHVISAMQPHQLAALYKERDDHPLRSYPEFRALGQMKGAVLTVSRVFMDAKVTEGYNLTGLDRDFFSMNGAMDLSHIMPKYREASVFDTLSDDGEVLEYYPLETLKAKLREDLAKIFPGMAKANVRKHLLARIGPDVLYHRPVPRLNSRFLPKSPVTPVQDLFLAGDWVDEFELGKEAAARSGFSAANAVLEADGRGAEAQPILKAGADPLVTWMQTNFISRWYIRRCMKRYLKQLPPARG